MWNEVTEIALVKPVNHCR